MFLVLIWLIDLNHFIITIILPNPHTFNISINVTFTRILGKYVLLKKGLGILIVERKLFQSNIYTY